MNSHILIDKFSEPLNGESTARFDIDTGDGNLMIDPLNTGGQELASGRLEYLQKQGQPVRSRVSSSGHAVLTLEGGKAGQPWFRFPWAACNGATDWQIHLNPAVRSDINAHSGGGNLKLDLAGMGLTCLYAETGGGNVEVRLPDAASNLGISAKTGAGNVIVEAGEGLAGSNVIDASSGAGNVDIRIPAGIAARIHASSGMGQELIDPRFSQVDKDTYQSAGFEAAADKVEINAHSGAGNVSVQTK